MKTYDTPPTDIVKFDVDQHLPVVSAFITAGEETLYSINAMLGHRLKKSDGVRMGFDVIRVHSLINPERDCVYISFGPSVSGGDGPLHDSREVAGVVGDQLWFTENGKYYSAKDELESRKKMMEAISGPLKELLGPAMKDLEKALEEMRRQREEGEDWKNRPDED